MPGFIRRIHIYAGVLTFAQLVVYGIAGLTATFQFSAERDKTPQAIRMVPFAVPQSATDKDVAALVYRTLNPPLARPIPDWFLRRTADHHLLLDFYSVNGIERVIVMENERKLRVEKIRSSLWLFLEDIHAATLSDEDAPAAVRAWAAWNEVAMWTLLGFSASGVWLWLSSRPRYVWAWTCLGVGTACFAVLWMSFR